MDFQRIHVPTVQIYDNLFMIIKRTLFQNLFFEKGRRRTRAPREEMKIQKE